MKPIDALFAKADLRCTKCGQAKCDCWEKCSCGWFAEKGKPCGNPNTGRCSTKIKYGGKKRGARQKDVTPQVMLEGKLPPEIFGEETKGRTK